MSLKGISRWRQALLIFTTERYTSKTKQARKNLLLFPFIILLRMSTCCVSPLSTFTYNSIFSINPHAHFKGTNFKRHSGLGIRTGYLSVVSEPSLKFHVGYNLEKYLIFYLHFQVFLSFFSFSVQILRNITMPSCKKETELMNRLKFRTRASWTIFWKPH